MRVSVVGTGYVGLVTGVCFAELGNDVILADVIKEKLEKIDKGIPPIFEPGLEELLKKNLPRISTTTSTEKAVLGSDITFICVGTPSKEDGSIDLRYVEQAARDIGAALAKKTSYHVVVVKSTVVPGTSNKVLSVLEEVSGKIAGRDFGVCMNPEFLREGRAVEDFLNPDRIVVGSIDRKSGNVVDELYKTFDCKKMRTDLKTAEMIKYASNALLATKISYANDIGNICKELGIDVYKVMEGVGLDHRFSPNFLNAGIGFGGSCFPKDVAAIVATGRSLGYRPLVLESVLELNKNQPYKMVEILKKRVPDLRGKTVAVLGLAFKPGTDDIREAPSIKIVKKLLEEGAAVNAWDPKAEENFRKLFPNINYFTNPRGALDSADACLVLTEWPELKELEDKDFEQMKNKIIIEGRKVLNPEKVKGFEGVCWPGGKNER